MKVLLIGNSGVGKSNLLMRFAVFHSCYIQENKFTQNMLNTIGVDFVLMCSCRKLNMLTKMVRRSKLFQYLFLLFQWDTAGQERFRTITNGYYRGADGILIVYDLTDRDSFENVNMWYEEMSRSVNQKIVSILIGNKLDMDSRRAVSTEQGRMLGNQIVSQHRSIRCHLRRHQPSQVRM